MRQTQVLSWFPAANTTPGTAIGWNLTQAAASQTVSHPILATTNMQTQMVRTRFASATSAVTRQIGWRVSHLYIP
jgi:hypothetical protein